MTEDFYVYYESNPEREKKRVGDILDLQRGCEVKIKQVFTEDDFLTQLKQQSCKGGWFNFYGGVKIEKKVTIFDKPVALVSCFVDQPQGEQLLSSFEGCEGIERDRNGNGLVELSRFLGAKVVE